MHHFAPFTFFLNFGTRIQKVWACGDAHVNLSAEPGNKKYVTILTLIRWNGFYNDLYRLLAATC